MQFKRIIAITLIVGFASFFLFVLVQRSHNQDKRSYPVELKDEVIVKQSTLPPFTFDDLWDPKFSYSNFYPDWVSPTEYLFRDEVGIQKMDLETGKSDVLVSNDFYSRTKGNGWAISADEEFLLVRTSYFKQWRHSYNGSYAVYKISDEKLMFELANDKVQYMSWSPFGHRLVWVVENDIHVISDVTDLSTATQLTSDGQMNKIFNGIPDWVYEEEMVSSTNNIFWSPDSKYMAYLVTNDTNVEIIEFSKYGNTQYPEMVKVAYPKAGTPNPTVQLKVYDFSSDTHYVVTAPVIDIGTDHLFNRVDWFPDSQSFMVTWLNRISTKSVPQLCSIEGGGLDCKKVSAGIEEKTDIWIGNGGSPFTPIVQTNESYFTMFSNSEGYWHVARVNVKSNTRDFLTTGTSVVTSLRGYDPNHNWLYFLAAYPLPRNRHLMRIPTNGSSYPLGTDSWECMTCDFDATRCGWISPSFSPSLTYLVVNCGGPDVPMTTIQKLESSGNYSTPELYINNLQLQENKLSVKWPIKSYGEIQSTTGITFLYQMFKPIDFDPQKTYPLLIEVYGGPGFQKVQDRWTRSWAAIHMVSQYDIIVVSLDARGSGYRGDDIAKLLYKKIGQLEKLDTTEVAQHFAQQAWIDENNIAVWGWSYGGYTTTFTISEGSGVFKCGMAVAPLATRFLYDTIHTERYMTLPDDNPDGYEKCSILNSNLQNFNKSWSLKSVLVSNNGGNSPLFVWLEAACTKLRAGVLVYLESFCNSGEVLYEIKASYSIIHGTADDNVHFQNAALISKALVEADVRFDNFFYADEAHSINTGPNANRHIYKLLTRKTRQCFSLPVPENQSESPIRKFKREIGENQPIDSVRESISFNHERDQDVDDFY